MVQNNQKQPPNYLELNLTNHESYDLKKALFSTFQTLFQCISKHV